MNLFTQPIIAPTSAIMSPATDLARALRGIISSPTYRYYLKTYTYNLYFKAVGAYRNKLCWCDKNNPLKVNNVKIKNRNKRIYKWLTKE